MLGKNILRRLVTLTTMAAVWTVYSMVALAAPVDVTGEISVTGQVTVNGQSAVSNATVVSGSTIVTGADSSATVSLGRTGRVEILADSNLTLRFTENSIVGILSSGKLRVSNSAGVATTITTKDMVALADAGQADSFAVEVECSHTHVDTLSGAVTMREGSNDKQVVAGTTATAGNLAQTGCVPCLRPNSAPPIPIAGPWWLALLAVGAAGAGIILGTTRQSDTQVGGGVIIVSPTR